MNPMSAFRKEKGAALVVGIVLLVVSTILALVAMQSSTFQERMASNQYNKTVSLMAAEFGAGALIQEILAAGYDASQGLAQWQGAVIGSEGTPVSAGAEGGFYWVQLLNHIGTPEPEDPLRLAVHGVSRNEAGGPNLGRTQLNLEVDVFPLGPPGPSDDAAINFIQPLSVYRAPNSNAYTITGAQEDGETTGPAIGVSSDTDRDFLNDELGPDGVDRLHNYDGGIVSKDFGDFWNNQISDSEDGTQLYSSTLGNTQTALQKFVNLACSEAGARCGPSVAANTTGRGKNKAAAMVPKITVVRGDALVDFGGGSVGAGLLIVEGDLYMNGNPSWDGMIITLGGTIDVSGGGNGVFNGSIYSLNTDTSTTPWERNDGEGEGITWITRGGGKAAYNHSCALVEQALGLLEDADYGGGDEIPQNALNARAIFGDNHGCGPGGGTGSSPGGVEYVFRWVEVQN